MKRQLAYGFRLALRSRLSTVTAVVCLATSLGAAALVYAAISGLVLKPSAVPAAAHVSLLELELTAAGKQQHLRHWSYPAYAAARDVLAADAALHAVTLEPLSLTVGAGDGAARLPVEIVSPGYFGALGVELVVGADIGDAGSAAETRVWLSHATWRDRFDADPAILGRIVTLQGLPFTVAGVAPPEFRGLSEQAALWLPMRAAPSVTFARRLEGATSFWHAVFATVEADAPGLEARLPGAAAAIERTLELRIGGEAPRIAIRSSRWSDARIDPALTTALGGIAVCAAILLAVVTLNLVLLALARLELRRRELGIRSALGASRGALFAAAAGEMLVVFAIGLVAAALLARLGLGALARFEHSIRFGAATLAELSLDRNVIAALAGTAALMLALALLPPALASGRIRMDALRASDGVRGGRVQRVLAAGQFALATALAIGAALAGGAAWRAVTTPLGFDPDGVLSAQVAIPRALAPSDGTSGFLARMEAAMATLPGVESVATAACLPVRGGCDSVLIEAVPRIEAADWPVALNFIGGDYFGTLGIAVREGRGFRAGDDAAAAPVVVLNESAARTYFPEGRALGQRLKVSVGWPEQAAGATVVGVVADVVGTAVDAAAEPAVYVPAAQMSYDDNYLLLRAKRGIDAESLLPALTRTLARVEPTLALWDAATMSQRFDDLTARRRIAATLVVSLAGLSALLAGTGVFAVYALSVRRRRREFAVRMAVGASRASVQRGMLRDAMRLSIGASGVGMALGAAGAGVLDSRLPLGVISPLLYLVVALVMGTVALAASWWPAREAARVEPMRLLGQDSA